MEKRTILTTPVEFDRSDFFSLLSLSVGAAIARQNAFGAFIDSDGGDGWNVDPVHGAITFGKREFPCGIIGTESETGGTWLWGWAHTESGLPENAAAPSRRAKRAIPDCAEFTTAKFELDELHNGHNLSMVTICAAEKNVCYYRCPYNGGALFVQIDGLPEEVFAPPSLDDIARRQLEIIREFLCDHKLLAAGLLHMNGFGFADGGNFITAERNGRTLRFDFEKTVGFFGKNKGLFRTANISLV